MEHYFDLPVLFKEEEISLKGRLVTFGYIYKFYIIVDGKEVVFERDDEGKYRALLEDLNLNNKDTDKNLLKTIARSLETLSSLSL